MRIARIISNNTVVVIVGGRELILTGSGIGFQKKTGQSVDVKRIEKVFQIRDKFIQKYEQIYKHIKPHYFQIAERILLYAEKELNCSLSSQFIFSLADHMAFAIERQETSAAIPNLMLHDLRLLYPEEYKVGEFGRKLIKQELAIELSADETGYFTLHIINARLGEPSVDVTNILVLSNGILKIVHDEMGIDFKEDDFEYNRFLMHLKFLARRIFAQEKNIFCIVENMYSELIADNVRLGITITKIKDYLKESFDYELSDEEATYLALHIIRISG